MSSCYLSSKFSIVLWGGLDSSDSVYKEMSVLGGEGIFSFDSEDRLRAHLQDSLTLESGRLRSYGFVNSHISTLRKGVAGTENLQLQQINDIDFAITAHSVKSLGLINRIEGDWVIILSVSPFVDGQPGPKSHALDATELLLNIVKKSKTPFALDARDFLAYCALNRMNRLLWEQDRPYSGYLSSTSVLPATSLEDFSEQEAKELGVYEYIELDYGRKMIRCSQEYNRGDHDVVDAVSRRLNRLPSAILRS